MYYPMMWGGVFSFVWALFIIAGVIALIAWMKGSRSYGHPGKWHQYCETKKPSINILEERYAKGEIDKKEFEEKRKVLMWEDEEMEKKEDKEKKESDKEKS